MSDNFDDVREALRADIQDEEVQRAASTAIPSSITDTSATPSTLSSSVVTRLNSLQQGSNDHRVKLTPMNPSEFYGSGIMDPLKSTGLIFPYTPTIQISQNVNYSSQDLVHTNGQVETFQRSPNMDINITGKFTIQNLNEGKYALAAIHFMRTASKMYFGTNDGANAGLPPHILKLNGFGTYMFKDLRCILKTYSFNYEETMDIVPVTTGAGTTYLPVMFSLSCSVTVQQTPRMMREEFSFKEFRTGSLIARGGWI